MPYTYILYSVKLNKYYIGACTDMTRRLHEHNTGHSKFTSTGIPWTIKYKEEENITKNLSRLVWKASGFCKSQKLLTKKGFL